MAADATAIAPPPVTPAADLEPAARKAFALFRRVQLLDVLEACCHEDLTVRLAWGEVLKGVGATKRFLAETLTGQPLEAVRARDLSLGHDAFAVQYYQRRNLRGRAMRWEVDSLWVYRVRDGRLSAWEHHTGVVRVLDREDRGEQGPAVLGELRGEAAQQFLYDRVQDLR